MRPCLSLKPQYISTLLTLEKQISSVKNVSTCSEMLQGLQVASQILLGSCEPWKI